MQESITGYRLSPQQRGIWLRQQGRTAYCAQSSILLEGALQRESLRRAVTEVVKRHEVLRTTFQRRAEITFPFQVVAVGASLVWDEIDLSGGDERQRAADCESFLRQDKVRPFDLERGPVLRASLLRMAKDEHLLVLSLPALCADAQTLNNLFGEIADGYAAAVRGQELTEQPLQYVHFSTWQNELLEEEEGQAGSEYWQQNRFVPTSLSLPRTEKPTPDAKELLSEVFPLIVNQQLATQLAEVAERLGAPMPVMLQTCWQTLLSHLTKEQDVTIAALFANRDYEELQGAFGVFSKWLPVRARFASNLRFDEAVAQVNQATDEAVERLDYFPEEQAAEGADDEQGAGLIGFEYLERQDVRTAGGVAFSLAGQYNCTAHFNLKLSCVQTGGALVAEFHYHPGVFQAASVERLARQFATLLESIVEDPSAPVGGLNLIGDAERHETLHVLNGSERDFARDKCFHQLFEEQAARTPERPAAEFAGRVLTYTQLNAKANQLAYRLRALGVGPEIPVGLCMERSLEMIVALLAIHKAGGAYVPVNLEQPPERIAYMLENVRAQFVVTKEPWLKVLPADDSREFICLDRDAGVIAEQSAENLESAVMPGNSSHIIYTSGSTGRAKAIVATHDAVMNFWMGFHEAVYTQFADAVLRVSINAPLSFDGSVKQYLTLLHGHTICILPQEIRPDGGAMVSFIKRHSLDVLDCTPTQLNTMLDAGLLGHTDIKLVIISGEQVKEAMWQRLAAAPSGVFYNVYGPTECTVDTTVCRISSGDETPSIGRPLPNAQVYVLDEKLDYAPLGAAGELCIGGAGLARGYFDAAELTAEKFIPHPFGTEPGARLYRTGDLVRFLPDGRLEFLGRIDNQVKIRGFRVELGEIESALLEHETVRQALVVLKEGARGGEQLVAYVVGGQQAALPVGELRAFLSQKLPEYMVPSAFVALNSLPLTVNGKVDKGALPAPGNAGQEASVDVASPRTSIGEVVASVFADVLGVERVGAHDRFFDLGGHSLLATQLMSRLQETFGIELPLRSVFETPTVTGLAEAVKQALDREHGLVSPPLVRVSRAARLPLSFGQQRLWFLDQLQPGNSAFNIPVAVRLTGALDVEALERCFNEIVRRHEILRTSFAAAQGEPYQVISPHLTLALPVVDLQELPESERDAKARQLIEEESRKPFDLSQIPLLRVTLLRLQPQQHILILSLHHIVADGWSSGVLIKELVTLYKAFAEDRPSPLAELAVQYADFATWQHEWLSGEVLEKQLGYWKQQLRGVQTLALPTARPRPAAQTYRGGRKFVKLPKDLTESLKSLSRREGATLFMTLTAAFQTLLHRYTEQEDIVTGFDVASRTKVETEDLIGFFVNMLALRTDFSGNPSFRELLRRVRRTALEAYAHQDLPFEKLVAALHLEREKNCFPVFQVVFVLQNAPASALELPGLTLHSVPFHNETVKFDIFFSLTEGAEGLGGFMDYSADLFDERTIARLLEHFKILLGSIVADCDERVSALEIFSEEERQQRIMQEQERQESNRKKLGIAKRKAVNLADVEPVRTGYLSPDADMPLVVQPNMRNVELLNWARDNRQTAEAMLRRHGAVLFRGFDVRSPEEFESFAQALCPDLFGEYEDLPRSEHGRKVYGSTPYPPDQAILFHNESSHLHRWPMRIFFFCLIAAQSGGETPIVDCRRVYQRLSEQTRRKLERLGLMYVRNFTEGLDVSWQEFFKSEEREGVEEYCREAGIELRWRAEGGLTTRQVCEAVREHPQTGEKLFFNQVQLFHPSFIEPEARKSLLALFREEDFPRNIYYGDGSPIEASVIEEVNEAYRAVAVSFPWQEGDILMLDNMMVAHSRNPYVGPRKIVVAMGDMMSISEQPSDALGEEELALDYAS